MVEAFEDLGTIALEEVDVVGIQDVGQEGVEEIVAGSFWVVFDGEGFSDWTAGMGGVEMAVVDLQSSIGHCSIKAKAPEREPTSPAPAPVPNSEIFEAAVHGDATSLAAGVAS